MDAPRAAVDFAALDFVVAAFAAVDLAAGFARGLVVVAGFTSSGSTSASSASACSSGLDVAAGFPAADFEAADFAAADFAAGLAALGFAAADLAAVVLFVAPDRAGVDELSAAAPVGDSPVSGTPVPVPSAASSSWLERETEVTKPTYQDGPRSAHSGLVTRCPKLGIH